jgi:hypothetical protein
MFTHAGDSQSGEQHDSRRLNPQRLDTLVGKILRIVPDLREHTGTSTVSENGRYRVPNDNPFTDVAGARKETWAYGLRNPHRLVWDVAPGRPARLTNPVASSPESIAAGKRIYGTYCAACHGDNAQGAVWWRIRAAGGRGRRLTPA